MLCTRAAVESEQNLKWVLLLRIVICSNEQFHHVMSTTFFASAVEISVELAKYRECSSVAQRWANIVHCHGALYLMHGAVKRSGSVFLGL